MNMPWMDNIKAPMAMDNSLAVHARLLPPMNQFLPRQDLPIREHSFSEE
jgi:hypothetical protein